MLRRRPAPAAALERSTDDAPSSPGSPLAEQLREDGWVVPRALQAHRSGSHESTTLVGTVGSPTATTVDRAGLVVGAGWSLDWWIGADDRWHLPAQEASVRQGVVGDAPIVETRLRVPGGDIVHRAYGIRAPRMVGDEWVVVEIENRTPVPCAVALVLRPFVADAVGSIGSIEVAPTLGGIGRDEAHLVRIDGRPSLVLPRRPNRVAVGSRADGDLEAVVVGGDAGTEVVGARCEGGLATEAFIYPLAHTAVLRVLVPVAEVSDAETIALPSVVPDAATVASGWDVHARGPRLSLPEPRAQVAFERAARQLGLAGDGHLVRRDGLAAAAVELGATELILGALDVLDRPTEVGPIVLGWADLVADATPEQDATLLLAISRHHRLHRVAGVLDWVLPDVAAAIERLDRADRRGRLDAAQRPRFAAALEAAADLLDAGDQGDAGSQVREVAARLRSQGSSSPAASPPGGTEPVDRLQLVATELAAGAPGAFERFEAILGDASPTGTWSGPGRGGRRVGHDLAAAGALVLAVRSLLVAEQPDGLDLLPTLPPTWFGGGVELHDAPTGWGRLSYGVRWHGTRPALLWDLQVHEGLRSPVLRAPALDPSWSTTEPRGEALLAEVAPPEGIDLYRHVADHPDIDPEMRRPGEDPGPPPASLPEGGSFS